MKKRVILILMLALLACATAFAVTYATAMRSAGLPRVSEPEAELLWLRREFHLNDTQFAAVKRLHTDYQPRCGVMCQRIADINGHLESLLAVPRHEVTPEISQAIAESSDLQRQCREMMLAHLYEVGSQMNGPDAARYLAMMTPCVLAPGQSFHALSPSDRGSVGPR